MDKTEELQRQLVAQKEQLSRYETRLKDVVTAYKGLLKEKEALEASVAALSNNTTTNAKESGEGDAESNADGNPSVVPEEKQQIATIMNSLATLSAEKSRMEMSFQHDKKQLRQEITARDKQIRELNDKLQDKTSNASSELKEYQSKLIVERHAREKETSDQLKMIRELQKLLTDERQLKDNLQMQLKDLRAQIGSDKSIIAPENGGNHNDLQREIERLRQQLRELELGQSKSGNEGEREVEEQQEVAAQLKLQHAAALKVERQRALKAQEENKKLMLFHEERVANLEARLSELSWTVGNYDRLRQQDQENIQRLKERLVESVPEQLKKAKEENLTAEEIIMEIRDLKQALLIENGKRETPLDISTIIAPTCNDHARCLEDQKKMHHDVEESATRIKHLLEEGVVQRNHIRNLQEKIKVLNQNIEDQENELKGRAEQHSIALQNSNQVDQLKQIIQSMETEYRGKMAEMELYMQKQRERSLSLLEEKDNEIKALKTSFDLFVPIEEDRNEAGNKSTVSGANNLEQSKLNPLTAASATDQLHILHYVHELARKDLEISALRKTKHSAETAMRQAIKDKISAQEELHDQVAVLEEQVGRLERCQSREGANLEYLKNVILSFLITKKQESKRHMVNAIAQVLKFSPSEIKMVNNYFYHNK